MTIHQFAVRLTATSLSSSIREAAWVVPSVQTLHIMAVTVVMSAALFLDLRIVGVLAEDVPIATYVRRYFRWWGFAVLVLLLSGLTLIIGEPSRTLQNWVFWTKMVLVAVGTVLSILVAAPVWRDAAFWDGGSKRKVAAALATVSLLIWVAAVFCGRWIAYVL